MNNIISGCKKYYERYKQSYKIPNILQRQLWIEGKERPHREGDF